MTTPLPIERFAELSRIPVDDLVRWRDAGLVDPDHDDLFDEYDALRVQFIQALLGRGMTVDELASQVATKTLDIPYFGDLMYPRAAAMSVDDVAAALGFSAEHVRALSTALGLPITRAFDQGDLAALEGARAVEQAGLPFTAILDATRVFGDAFRRITQTEIALVHDHLHGPMAEQGIDDREIALRSWDLLRSLQHVLEPLFTFIHRQFLLRATVADLLHHMEQGGTRAALEATILFVDLSSFTTLASVHGDEVAAAILARFDVLVRTLSLQHHGTLVKQIGDEFMLTFRDPADAVRFSLAVAERADAEDQFPTLRVGIHAGPVLYRVGDYVGTTVNIASRVASAASGGEIVVTQAVADVARAAGISVEPAGTRILRGIEDAVQLFRVPRTGRALLDPVCGMRVSGGLRLTRAGEEFAFCSEECLRRFVADPERFAG